MKCTHPLKAYYQPGRPLIFASLSEFYDDYTRGQDREFNDHRREAYGDYTPIKVPCGKCLACRINRSSQWALRCQHEKYYYSKASFITLTYNNEHVPPQLIKKDLQNFLKRLRKEFFHIKIRYFACGEYGKKLSRPHYHAVLFGVDFSEDRYVWRKTVFGKNVLYRSPTLERLWPFGFSTIGEVTFESAAYVARYCTKKIYGKAAEDHYIDPLTGKKKEKEFQVQSLKPGIGYRYYKQFGEDFFKVGYCVSHKKSKIPIPRYYKKLLELDNPALLAKYKETSQAYGKKLEQEAMQRMRDSFESTLEQKHDIEDFRDIFKEELSKVDDLEEKQLLQDQFPLFWSNVKDNFFADYVKEHEESDLSREELYNIQHFERTQDEIDNFLGELTA